MGVVHLVRHGQASFGAEDYDVLSPLGLTQSSVLGVALAGRNVSPGLVLSGAMRRQVDTATTLVRAGGFTARVETEPAWNEFDHEHVLDAYADAVPNDLSSPSTYWSWFERATGRWASGQFDGDYKESFAAFTGRVEEALHSLQAATGPGDTAVVVTSGGTIAWVAASLLGAGAEQWHRLNRVAVNTGVTTIVFGGRGATLVSFNEHSHLNRQQLTYR